MNTRNSFVRLLYVAAVFLLAACHKTGEDPTPQPRPKTYAPEDQSVRGRTEQTETTSVAFQPQVIEVRKDIQEASIQSPSANEMHFNITPATEQIRVGDVLYSSGIQEGTPCYARKVKRVKKSDGKIVCEVTQASIDEVFQELEQKDSLVFSDTGIVTYDIESQLNDNTTPSVARTRGSYKRGPVKLKVDWTPDRQKGMRPIIKLEVILLDRDKNYDTKNDQFACVLGLEFTKFANQTSYKNKTLNLTGEVESKAELEFKYGYSKLEEEADQHGLFDEAFKGKKLFGPSGDLQKMMKKRILLATVPVKKIPAGDLSIGFSVDFYLIIELDLEGKFSLKFEYSPFIISYNASVSLNGLNLDAKVCDPIKPSLKSVNLKGGIKATGKLGLSSGFVFHLPAFPNPQKEDEKSGAGLYFDLYYDISAAMERSNKEDPDVILNDPRRFLDFVRYTKAGIGMGVFADLYFEANMYLWIFNIKERYSFFKQPFSVLKGLEVNMGWLDFREGETMKFTPIYPNTQMKEEAQISASNNHATLKIKDDGDLSFSGNSAGETRFVIEYPKAKGMRMDYYWVNVLKNTYSADSTYIQPSKGEQL